MILTAIVRFVKRLKRTIKGISGPSMPKIRIPKPRPLKAPRIDTDFMRRIASTAVHAPGLGLGGLFRSVKRIFNFAIKPRAPGKRRHWYHPSPAKVMLLASIIAVPELLLQTISFTKWYYPRVNSDPVILCIADYQTSYPAYLQDQLKNSSWKVVAETNPSLTINSARKILEDYRQRRNLAIVYLTLGMNEVNPFLRKKLVVWSNSFEWKFRVPELGHFFSTGNTDTLIGSERFHTPKNSSAFLPDVKSISQVAPQTIGSSGQKAQANQTQPQPQSYESLQKTTATKHEPELYDNPKFQELMSKPFKNQVLQISEGSWNSEFVNLVLKKDGEGSFAGFKMSWRLDGNRLILKSSKRQMDFQCRKEGSDLILMSDFFPMSLVMKKTEGNLAPLHDPRGIAMTTHAWYNFLQGDSATAENLLKQAEQKSPNYPPTISILSRIEYGSGRYKEKQARIEWLSQNYRKHSDQSGAEAFFYSIVGYPDRDKIALARNLLARYPSSSRLWLTLSEYASNAGNLDFSKAATEHALSLIPEYLVRTRATAKAISRKFQQLNQSGTSEKDNLGQQREQFWQNQIMTIGAELKNCLTQLRGTKTQLVFVPYPQMNSGNRVLTLVAQQTGTEIIRLEQNRDQNIPGKKDISEATIIEQSNTIAKEVLKDINKRKIVESQQ